MYDLPTHENNRRHNSIREPEDVSPRLLRVPTCPGADVLRLTKTLVTSREGLNLTRTGTNMWGDKSE